MRFSKQQVDQMIEKKTYWANLRAKSNLWFGLFAGITIGVMLTSFVSIIYRIAIT